ncbi:MAG: hypothetical protein SCH68_11430 [Brevefilum sp.]|nr:hypothetical protein [Brevefilum sp.]
MNAALAWRLVAAYARIRLLCFESTSAYVRFSLSAFVSEDMIKASFVVGARGDRTYVLA